MVCSCRWPAEECRTQASRFLCAMRLDPWWSWLHYLGNWSLPYLSSLLMLNDGGNVWGRCGPEGTAAIEARERPLWRSWKNFTKTERKPGVWFIAITPTFLMATSGTRQALGPCPHGNSRINMKLAMMTSAWDSASKYNFCTRNLNVLESIYTTKTKFSVWWMDDILEQIL